MRSLFAVLLLVVMLVFAQAEYLRSINNFSGDVSSNGYDSSAHKKKDSLQILHADGSLRNHQRVLMELPIYPGSSVVKPRWVLVDAGEKMM